jgi:hypothetical protein
VTAHQIRDGWAAAFISHMTKINLGASGEEHREVVRQRACCWRPIGRLAGIGFEPNCAGSYVRSVSWMREKSR